MTKTKTPKMTASAAPPRLLEIINMSDAYTIDGTDEDAAILAVIHLGNGKYALQDNDGKEILPLFLFGGHEKFFEAKPQKTVEAFQESVGKERLADALESVMIGSISENLDLLETLKHMPATKRADFLVKRHDRKRSSLNDIGGRAAELAKCLRKSIRAEKTK